MQTTSQNVVFQNAAGDSLSGILDAPLGEVKAYGLFGHCFTCSKDIKAIREISRNLAKAGFGILRFDFAGLGNSEGNFPHTNFSTNITDLEAASNYLAEQFQAPELLIGHSLGGAAALSAASSIGSIKAVVTIGAPYDPQHVSLHFGNQTDQIQNQGFAVVEIAGREFHIGRQFLDDLKENKIQHKLAALKSALLVMHSPVDSVVGIENAQQIFVHARHPKSFISLGNADHMLSNSHDASFAASMIAAWASNYIKPQKIIPKSTQIQPAGVLVTETGNGKFHNLVQSGKHTLIADEPESAGGDDTGPSPYDYLAAALGACTNMTMRMYADFKKMKVGPLAVRVKHHKVHAHDCSACTEEERSKGGKIDIFTRTLDFSGVEDIEIRQKLASIADKCPVHKTLSHTSKIKTVVK